MTRTVTEIGPGATAAATVDLARAATALAEATESRDHLIRYACAHVAALRAAAAVLAVRARPTGPRRRAQRNAWVLLAEVAPELAEWAAFFAANADKRAAAEAGLTRAVSEREADDLLRDATTFCELVEFGLGLPRQTVLSQSWMRAS